MRRKNETAAGTRHFSLDKPLQRRINDREGGRYLDTPRNHPLRRPEAVTINPVSRNPSAVQIRKQFTLHQTGSTPGTAGTAAAVEQAQFTPCFASQQREWVIDTFDYDPATDQVHCVEGHASIGAIRQEQGTLYYFSTQACGPCPRRRQCLAPSEIRRRVFISDVYRPKLPAGEAGRAWRKAHYRHRYKIEQKNAELKRWHGLERARYWGRLKVHGQALLAALVANAKRMVKLLQARGQPVLLAGAPG